MQYAFVKHPNELINFLFFQRNKEDFTKGEKWYFLFEDREKLQLQFKTTQVYKALSYNKDDCLELAILKQDYTKSYVELLNAMGLSIIAKIIKSIDLICEHTESQNLEKELYDYFSNELYMDDLQGIISFTEHPIDHISFLIGSCNLNEKGIQDLNKIKDFYLEAVDNIQNYPNKIEEYDLKKIKNFNYDKVDEIIMPYFNNIYKQENQEDKNLDVDEDDFIEKDGNIKDKRKSNDKYLESFNSNDKNYNEASKKRKIISIEEAIKINFAGLVGLKEVKNAILKKTKLIKKLPAKLIDCNFRLTGNPGVGKTTVAEAMSKTFYDAGIIKKDVFVQLNGAGLKGKYVGHTIPKVQEVFEKAKGGTLFLDEVYSLISSGDDRDSFAQEAITELMIQVENLYNEQKTNPDEKTLVILAGYKDKVNQLLEKNIGFKRRFPNVIDIRDYSVEELREIFNININKDGFNITEKARLKIDEILSKEKKKVNFSNAGYVRNLVQAVEENQAARSNEEDFTIDVNDVEEAEKNLNEDIIEKPLIGFH